MDKPPKTGADDSEVDYKKENLHSQDCCPNTEEAKIALTSSPNAEQLNSKAFKSSNDLQQFDQLDNRNKGDTSMEIKRKTALNRKPPIKECDKEFALAESISRQDIQILTRNTENVPEVVRILDSESNDCNEENITINLERGFVSDRKGLIDATDKQERKHLKKNFKCEVKEQILCCPEEEEFFREIEGPICDEYEIKIVSSLSGPLDLSVEKPLDLCLGKEKINLDQIQTLQVSEEDQTARRVQEQKELSLIRYYRFQKWIIETLTLQCGETVSTIESCNTQNASNSKRKLDATLQVQAETGSSDKTRPTNLQEPSSSSSKNEDHQIPISLKSLESHRNHLESPKRDFIRSNLEVEEQRDSKVYFCVGCQTFYVSREDFVEHQKFCDSSREMPTMKFEMELDFENLNISRNRSLNNAETVSSTIEPSELSSKIKEASYSKKKLEDQIQKCSRSFESLKNVLESPKLGFIQSNSEDDFQRDGLLYVCPKCQAIFGNLEDYTEHIKYCISSRGLPIVELETELDYKNSNSLRNRSINNSETVYSTLEPSELTWNTQEASCSSRKFECHPIPLYSESLESTKALESPKKDFIQSKSKVERQRKRLGYYVCILCQAMFHDFEEFLNHECDDSRECHPILLYSESLESIKALESPKKDFIQSKSKVERQRKRPVYMCIKCKAVLYTEEEFLNHVCEGSRGLATMKSETEVDCKNSNLSQNRFINKAETMYSILEQCESTLNKEQTRSSLEISSVSSSRTSLVMPDISCPECGRLLLRNNPELFYHHVIKCFFKNKTLEIQKSENLPEQLIDDTSDAEFYTEFFQSRKAHSKRFMESSIRELPENLDDYFSSLDRCPVCSHEVKYQSMREHIYINHVSQKFSIREAARELSADASKHDFMLGVFFICQKCGEKFCTLQGYQVHLDAFKNGVCCPEFVEFPNLPKKYLYSETANVNSSSEKNARMVKNCCFSNTREFTEQRTNCECTQSAEGCTCEPNFSNCLCIKFGNEALFGTLSFVCRFCIYPCKNIDDMINHYTIHKLLRKCYKNELDVHPENFKCSDCLKVFNNIEELNEHLQLVSIKEFTCLICHDFFPTKASFYKHSTYHLIDIYQYKDFLNQMQYSSTSTEDQEECENTENSDPKEKKKRPKKIHNNQSPSNIQTFYRYNIKQEEILQRKDIIEALLNQTSTLSMGLSKKPEINVKESITAIARSSTQEIIDLPDKSRVVFTYASSDQEGITNNEPKSISEIARTSIPQIINLPKDGQNLSPDATSSQGNNDMESCGDECCCQKCLTKSTKSENNAQKSASKIVSPSTPLTINLPNNMHFTCTPDKEDVSEKDNKEASSESKVQTPFSYSENELSTSDPEDINEDNDIKDTISESEINTEVQSSASDLDSELSGARQELPLTEAYDADDSNYGSSDDQDLANIDASATCGIRSKPRKVVNLVLPGNESKRCFKCNVRFNNPDDLVAHYLMHSIFMCLKCNRSFRTKYGFLEHLAQHTGKKPFFCSHCFLSFSTTVDFEIHKNKCSKREWIYF